MLRLEVFPAGAYYVLLAVIAARVPRSSAVRDSFDDFDAAETALHASLHSGTGKKQASKPLVVFLRPKAAYVWRPSKFIKRLDCKLFPGPPGPISRGSKS